jgi:chemotaxis protein CheC
MNTELLQKINEKAAFKSSEGLAKLIGRSAVVKMTDVQIRPVKELSEILKSDDIVAVIHTALTGDIQGAALVIFPKDTAFALSDFLHKREEGTTRRLAPLDESALKEVANIVSANYYGLFENILEVKIILNLPNFSFDMFGAMIEQVIAKSAKEGDQALISQLEFVFPPTTLKGYFVNAIFGVEKVKAIMGSLENRGA